MSTRTAALDWRKIAAWTWCAPMRWERYQGGRGVRGNRLIRRRVDYALEPEPRLFAEVMRRGFLEGA